MKTRSLALSLLVVPVAATLHADAPKPTPPPKTAPSTRVVVLDTGKALEKSKAGQDAMVKLEAKRKETLAKLEADQKRVTAKAEEIKAKGDSISQTAREKLEAELQVAQVDLRQKYETANGAWQQEAQAETANLKGMLDECVKQVAETTCKRDKCSELVVIDRMSGSVLYTTQSNEMTDKTVDEMDKAYAKKMVETTTAPTTAPTSRTV